MPARSASAAALRHRSARLRGEAPPLHYSVVRRSAVRTRKDPSARAHVSQLVPRLLLPACVNVRVPLEEAWHTARRQHRLTFTDPSMSMRAHAPSGSAAVSPLVGYDSYMSVASYTLHLLPHVAASIAHECGPWLLGFVAAAATLMAAPRGHRDKRLAGEVLYVRALRSAAHAEDGGLLGEPAQHVLFDAWAKLHRSGVLHERGVTMFQLVAADLARDTRLAANAKARATAVLRTCALEACGAHELHEAHFKKCAACQTAVYCCRQHQEEDWPAHKAAAEGGAGPSTGGA
jgi:hypothetical protein